MDKKLKSAFFALVLFGIVSIALVYLYSDKIAVLSPHGMIAERQSFLLMLATVLMLIVVVPTFLLTFFIAWRYQAGHKKAKYNPDWNHSHLAEAIWWGVPFIIIMILAVITWRSCHELDPFKPLQSDVRPIRIQAVALQWKWLFIYPDEGIATINVLKFPEKTPLNFEISADAPMNSFWLPDLGGQVYAMAGMSSKLHLIANEVGTYRGASSNISGEGFAGMVFTAEALEEEAYEAWLQDVQSSGHQLNIKEYQKLVAPTSYDPPQEYALTQTGLYDWIVMKYMTPERRHE